MEKLWSKTEIAHLKRHANSQSLEELAQRFHTDTKTVQLKLEELGLTSGGASRGSDVDAALENYEKALAKLHEGAWGEAAKLFEAVIGEADHSQMIDRAQQNLVICQQRLDEGSISEDPYLAAVFEKNRGNLDLALDHCRKGAAEDERFVYLEASIQALAGEEDQALDLLEKAIGLEPKNRVHAYHDPDFQDLQENEGFRGLLSAGA